MAGRPHRKPQQTEAPMTDDAEAPMTDDETATSPAEQLQDLLLDSEDFTDFLNEFTRTIAANLSQGEGEVWCAVTLLRERKAGTVASSSKRAEALDEIQYPIGDGP